MRWAWLGLRDHRPAEAPAGAELTTVDGDPSGFLVAWSGSIDRPSGAAKVDGHAIDPAGEPGWASLVWAPTGLSVPFDDPAVSHAMRRILALPPPAVFSTLIEGDDRLLGGLTAEPNLTPRLRADPFGVLFRPRVLRVGAGLLGLTPALPGPVIQRYGSSNPWPATQS